jgi:hypothetical protein
VAFERRGDAAGHGRGLAPGRFACTMIVGKSTAGSGATGRLKNAAMPASISPIVSRIVPTGRR